jgi:hypothetical protein
MEALDDATWRKSSYSGTNGGGCVEVGVPLPGHVSVRDTTDRAGAALDVPTDAWRAFISARK